MCKLHTSQPEHLWPIPPLVPSELLEIVHSEEREGSVMALSGEKHVEGELRL